VPATRINREIGHFCTASITLAPLRRTETTELTVKTKSVRDPIAGLRGLLVSAAINPQPASIPLRSINGDSANLAGAIATAPGNKQTRRNIEAAPLWGWHGGPASVTILAAL
jgi:hypothetical protein